MARRLVKAFNSADEFMEKVEEYFDTREPKYQTRAGLCEFLNITRHTLINYKNGLQGEEMQEVAEWAYTRLENKYELELNLKANPTGPIFALKQYGWKDNQDVEVKGTGSISIVTNIPRPKEE